MESFDYSFEISFYEKLDSRDAMDGRVLEILAHLYTKVGRIEEGLSMDLRLSKLRPKDAMVHYNLACSLALVGQTEEGFEVLKQSIEMGYTDFDWMKEDPDLKSIRSLPVFQELVKEIGSYQKESE